MKPFFTPFSAGAVAAGLAVAATAGLLVPATARAQPAGAQQAPASTAPAAGSTLTDALARLSQASGVRVVADSTVARQRVTPPIGPVTAETLEVHLAEIVRSLPGTQWAKVYLPATATSGSWTGDAVADYVYAQAKLFGNVGGAATAGTVEILGQQVPADRAQSVVAALNLKPVYLLTNSSRRTAAPASAAGNPGDWGRMTQEQQQQYAQQQAQQLMSMDPTSRQNMLQQQMAVLRTMVQQMTPQQRREMLQEIGGGFGGQGGAGGRQGGQGGRQGGRRGGGNQGGGNF